MIGNNRGISDNIGIYRKYIKIYRNILENICKYWTYIRNNFEEIDENDDTSYSAIEQIEDEIK